MRIIGMISGTSMDGIDAAAVDFHEQSGVVHARLLGRQCTPYSDEVLRQLTAALPPNATSAEAMCRLDTLIGHEFAAAADALSDQVGGVDAVASHGQTVFHWVVDGRALGTLQLGQPTFIAERLGCPVVADLRARDIAAGGQGAPLVALLDRLLLEGAGQPAAALNLGGIANMTVVGAGRVPAAWDIGPANALVDAVVVDSGLGEVGYDEGGRFAAHGRVDEALLAEMLADPYYAAGAPKSTGKEYFNLAYVRGFGRSSELSAEDLVATLTELTAQTVGQAIRDAGVEVVYASGGGVHNPVLMAGIERAAGAVAIDRTESLGVSADDKEAIAFALMGWCTLHGVAANVPSATGASGTRILGSIVPGAGPLRLPVPVPALDAVVFKAQR